MFFWFLLFFVPLALVVVGLSIYLAYRTIGPQIGKGKFGYFSPSIIRTKPLLIDTDGSFEIEALQVLEQNPGKARFDLLGESGPVSRIFYKSDLICDPFDIAGGSGTLKVFTRRSRRADHSNDLDGKEINKILEEKTLKEQRTILTEMITKLQEDLKNSETEADEFKQKYEDEKSARNKIQSDLTELENKFETKLAEYEERIRKGKEAEYKGKSFRKEG